MRFERLTQPSQIEELISFHNRHSEFCVIDVETSSANARIAKLIDIQLSGFTEEHVVIFDAQYLDALRNFDPKVVLVAHSYKYDAHVLFRHGVNLLSHQWRDTLLLGHLLDENRESYSLDSYVKEYWNDDFKETFWSKYKSYQEASEEDKLEYSCKDIYFTQKLYLLQKEQLKCAGIC